MRNHKNFASDNVPTLMERLYYGTHGTGSALAMDLYRDEVWRHFRSQDGRHEADLLPIMLVEYFDRIGIMRVVGLMAQQHLRSRIAVERIGAPVVSCSYQPELEDSVHNLPGIGVIEDQPVGGYHPEPANFDLVVIIGGERAIIRFELQDDLRQWFVVHRRFLATKHPRTTPRRRDGDLLKRNQVAISVHWNETQAPLG